MQRTGQTIPAPHQAGERTKHVGPKHATATCLRKYVTFSGRASRSEFWWFVGAVWVASAVASLVDATLFAGQADAGPIPATISAQTGPLSTLLAFATFLPGFTAGWRRMHDTGRMGLYLVYPVTIMIGLYLFISVFNGTALMQQDPMTGLSGLVIIGSMLLFLVSPLIVLWWLIRPSQPGSNAYGPNPNEVLP
jgi:uncharacterized membrane protein YhaH (DUF805 family)